MPQDDSKSPSGQEHQQTAETISNTHPEYQHFEDDTINLYELWIKLWGKKWIISAVTLVTAVGSVVYSLTIPAIYKAETILLPPKEKDFQSLNILQKQIASETELRVLQPVYDSKNVFDKFKQNLKSRKIQKKFILEKGLIEFLAPEQTQEDINEDVYEGFANMINVDDDDGVTFLSIELNNAEMAANWVNEFTKFVDKETISIMVEDLNDSIQNKIRDIEYTITSKRGMAERRRKDTIIRYSENAEIAKKLGMIGRVDATSIIQTTQNADFSTATTPLYYLGYEALMTEISILRNRKTDDPFIGGLRDLQEQLAWLSAVNFEQEKMSSVNIDERAYPTNRAISSNRRLIVSIATAVGLLSGIFLVLFIEFFKTQRKKYLE